MPTIVSLGLLIFKQLVGGFTLCLIMKLFSSMYRYGNCDETAHKFSSHQICNRVRFVFINLRADYLPLREPLSKLIIQKEASADSDDRKKAAEATALRRTINSWEFCLCLSGCSDIYDLYGELANVCQKVDILPHERYDKATALIEKFSTMMKSVDHSDCPNEVYSWPRYHKDLDVSEKEEKYMGKKIDNINIGHVRQTRLQSSTSGEMKIADGVSYMEIPS